MSFLLCGYRDVSFSVRIATIDIQVYGKFTQVAERTELPAVHLSCPDDEGAIGRSTLGLMLSAMIRRLAYLQVRSQSGCCIHSAHGVLQGEMCNAYGTSEFLTIWLHSKQYDLWLLEGNTVAAAPDMTRRWARGYRGYRGSPESICTYL